MNSFFWKSSKGRTILFFAVFIVLFLLYQYHTILFLRPQSIHQWRQTMCLSFALNYYQHGMNFLMPEVHLLNADGGTTGYAAAEFPLLYYINAFLWKIFGVHEFIPRLLNLLLVLGGIFSLSKIVYKRADAFWATLLPLFFFTSPIVAFYAASFLPDSAAFGIALMGLYCFDRFTEKQQYKWFYLFLFLSLIAGLLKVTSCMVFAAIFIFFILEKTKIFSFQTERKIFKGGWKDFFLFITTIGGISAWYFWAILYNKTHGGYISDSRILPIWNMSAEEIFNVIKGVDEIMWYQFLCSHTIFLFLFLFFAVVLLKRRADKYLWTLTMLLFAGTVLYVFLWFAVWNAHDYYMFPAFYFFILMLITFLDYLKNAYPELYSSWVLKIVFFLFFSYNVWYCSNNIRMRYGIGVGKIALTSTTTETGMWSWCDWNYRNTFKPLETIESYNRSLGMRPEDRVISIPDESVCISLYLMNQSGWTSFGNSFLDKDEIEKKIKTGAKYLVLSDSSLVNNPFINPYTKNKIGQFKNISIFDLKQQ